MSEKSDNKNTPFIYAGRRLNDGAITYHYYPIDQDGKLMRKFTFGKRIFSKVNVGQFGHVELEGDSISYKQKEHPSTLVFKDEKGFGTGLLFGDQIREWKAKDEVVALFLKSKKEIPTKSELFEGLNRIYNSMNSKGKSLFLADCIKEITKYRIYQD